MVPDGRERPTSTGDPRRDGDIGLEPRASVPERASPSRKSPDGEAEARTERRVRALENPLDVRPRPDPRFVRLEVRNPAHGTRYDVLLPSFPDREGGFCTCTDFARRGIGTCKHLESAWLWAAEHPEGPGPTPKEASHAADWAEIDRRLRAQGRSRALDPIRYRLAGSALFE